MLCLFMTVFPIALTTSLYPDFNMAAGHTPAVADNRVVVVDNRNPFVAHSHVAGYRPVEQALAGACHIPAGSAPAACPARRCLSGVNLAALLPEDRQVHSRVPVPDPSLARPDPAGIAVAWPAGSRDGEAGSSAAGHDPAVVRAQAAGEAPLPAIAVAPSPLAAAHTPGQALAAQSASLVVHRAGPVPVAEAQVAVASCLCVMPVPVV